MFLVGALCTIPFFIWVIAPESIQEQDTWNQNLRRNKTINDITGQRININGMPKRIVSFSPILTNILEETKFIKLTHKELTLENDKYIVIETKNYADINTLKELNPDLILVDHDVDQQMLAQLRQAGLNVLFMPLLSFKNFYEAINIFSNLFSRKKQADAMIKEIDYKKLRIIHKIKFQQQQRVKENNVPQDIKDVLFVHQTMQQNKEEYFLVAGKGTLLDNILEYIDLNNIIREKGNIWLTKKQINELGPDIIISHQNNDKLLEVLANVCYINDPLPFFADFKIVDNMEKITKCLYKVE